jgi:benzoylformate decarboxylase
MGTTETTVTDRESATVRDAVLGVLRSTGMTTLFSNPGSTEVAFLTDLPADVDFVLGLHEGSVVGMASGHALATGQPAAVLLHTTAGFGNAVGALATARTNRAPLVVLVGQQDRRHLSSEPFLGGKLTGLAGAYPVSFHEPARAQDVPGAVARAWHEASVERGPAVVVVPMDDWFEPAETGLALPTPRVLHASAGVDPAITEDLAAQLAAAAAPVIVAGPGADEAATWAALAELADRLDSPVWQAPYAAQAGFDQTSVRFAGHLPTGRTALRAALAGHDLVLVVGAPAFRQNPWQGGAFVDEGTAVAVVTAHLDEALHSSADVALVGRVPTVCADLADRVPARPRATTLATPGPAPAAPAPGEPMRAEHVYAAIAARLPAEATVIEESPSTRGKLLDLMPARAPFGFLTVAQGGLGFGLPAATGVKLARPDRPVVALLGDGASLYCVQTLWSARQYGIGALYVVLSNGGYAVMDRLAAGQGGKPPWPGFADISVSTIATGLGCPARRIESYDELLAVLDDITATLGERTEPLLLDVAVHAPTP